MPSSTPPLGAANGQSFHVPFSQHFEADFSPFAKLLDSSSLPFADNYFAIF